MSSLHPQDRVSLCRFTFADGRRCRMLRFSGHPDFCHYHAERDARDRAGAQLADDFTALSFRGYISACDVSVVLTRLLAAVARGHIRPRAARTMAFLAQTLLQSIRLSQHEFTATLGQNTWRNLVADSVNRRAAEVNAHTCLDSQPSPPSPQSDRSQARPTPSSANGHTPQPSAPTPASCRETERTTSAPASPQHLTKPSAANRQPSRLDSTPLPQLAPHLSHSESPSPQSAETR